VILSAFIIPDPPLSVNGKKRFRLKGSEKKKRLPAEKYGEKCLQIAAFVLK